MSAIVLCPNCREPVAASAIEVGGHTTCPACGAELAGATTPPASGFEPLSLDFEEPSYNSRDLPAARENVPRPAPGGAREPEPLANDPLMSREPPPPLDDLLFGEEPDEAPPPASGPDDPGGIDLGLDLMGQFDPGGPAAPAPAPAPTARPAQPATRAAPAAQSPDRPSTDPMQGLDIFLGELPSAGGSPLAPLDFGPPGSAEPSLPTPSDDELLGMSQGPGPVDIGSMLDSMLSAPPSSAPVAAPWSPAPAPADPFEPPTPPGPAGRPARPATRTSARPNGVVAPPAPIDAGDSSFALTLEGGADLGPEPAPARAPVVLPGAARGAGSSSAGAGGGQGALPAGVPWMAAPRRSAEDLGDEVVPRSGRKLLMIAGAAVLVLGAAAAFLTLGKAGRGGAAGALAPFAADLARDQFSAYERAAQAVAAVAGDDPAANAQAAELILTAVLGRGADKAKLLRVEELLAKVPAAGEMPPEAARARAMMAVARGRRGEVDTLLGAQASTPEGQLVIGLRRLRERKPDQALTALKAAATAPGRLLPVYLLGRAFEDAGQLDEARARQRQVLAGNPEHSGALVALARLTPGAPPARLAAAEKLLTRISASASPTEIGEARLLAGEALLALGRNAEAVVTLTSAAAASPQSVPAQVRLAEALVADGRAEEALTKLGAAEPALLTSAAGRLAMGSALVAAGKIPEGSAQLASVAAELPDNPRLPYWLGVAAESRRPMDEAAAEAGYRKALALEPTFLPASLRLAALLQRQGKAEAAIALIKEAERAGAPAEALELAWGQALVEAKNPGEAIAVFRKAVSRAPRLAAARAGLAGALEATGKPEEAEAELARAITELQGDGGLRERLADLLLKQGKKEAALVQLEAEAAAKPGNRAVQVRLAKLALELGRAAQAQKLAEAVVAEDPGTPEALFTLARAREAQGDTGGALQDYKRATAIGASSDLHLAYGRALAQRGRDDDALEQLTAAGDRALARLERGRIHLRRREVAEALANAEAAARLEPSLAAAHFLRGQCLDLMGNAEEAAAAWKAALRADPKQAEAHYRLGRHEMDKGKQALALVHFRQAAALDPREVPWLADLLFQLGFAEAQSGSKGNAASALKRYLEVAPNNAPARPEAERELARIARR